VIIAGERCLLTGKQERGKIQKESAGICCSSSAGVVEVEKVRRRSSEEEERK
jgi:hypothetical protein